MEPVTHVLTGACLARTGLNRRAAYATAGMALAAEFPDIDTLWGLRGPVAGFQHHRGLTHTFLGIPFEAGVLLLGFFLYDKLRRRRVADDRKTASGSTADSAPVRWDRLYGFLVLALLSHILLDYTNNYGVRPFFPFANRWYAASIVFIFDPLIFGLLLAGLLMPVLFGLIGQEVGARREHFRGRGWARAALAAILLLWGVRWLEHNTAVALAQDQTLRAPAADAEAIPEVGASGSEAALPQPESNRPLLGAGRSLASPDPLSIFRWYTATDFGPAYRLGEADSRQGTWVAGALFVKPKPSPLLDAAERSTLGRVYLDWSPMPVVSMTQGLPATSTLPLASHEGAATVNFSDLRFAGSVPFLQRGDRLPLTGTVVLDAGGGVLAQGMDGRFDH